jgi:hypothetical protein
MPKTFDKKARLRTIKRVSNVEIRLTDRPLKGNEFHVVDKSPVSPQQRAEKILTHEWARLNQEEVQKVVPKAIEYGSGDLKLMGYALKMLLNSPRARSRDWTEPEMQEMASAFYILGKIARMFSAYERGAMPADDQPHDIGVYTRMIQILRRTGAWPPGFDEYLKGEK